MLPPWMGRYKMNAQLPEDFKGRVKNLSETCKRRVAKLTLFASAEASYINGTTVIDGRTSL